MTPSAWTIHCDQTRQSVGGGPMVPAMDVDPRNHRITLDVRPLTGGSHEIASGAVVRHRMDLKEVDWTAALTWLDQPEAQALLQAVAAGYQAEMLWSGDWHVTWTDTAGRALQTVLDRVEVCARTGAPPKAGAE